MTRRILTSATLVTALAFSALPAAAAAQDAVEPADETRADKSVTGTITELDGTWYVTPVGGDPIELSFGPSWFKDLSALFGLSDGDADITIGGNLRDGMPNENASETAKEQAAKEPVLKIKIRTVNDHKRTKGKPVWAGGPKVVGEAHPGFEGWSKGQADKAPKPEKAAKVPPGQAKKAAAGASHGKPDKPGNGPKIPLKDD
jgi:hypothetical protein